MNPRLTDDQRQALHAHPGGPIEIVDDKTQNIYVLVSKSVFRELVDGGLRRELQIGFDQADAGDLGDWDVDEILALSPKQKELGRIMRGLE